MSETTLNLSGSSKSQRFLHICLSPSWGGLEMAVERWNETLAQNGHVNFNIGSTSSRLARSLKENDFHCEQWSSRKYFSPSFSLKLRRFVIDNKIDVITLHSLRDIWLVTPALTGLSKVKLIGFTHMLLNHRKKDWLHKKMYARLNALCVLTNYQKNALKDFLPVEDEKYQMIPNFLDTQKFHPEKRSQSFRESLGFLKSDFVIGCIGRIERLKGQWELTQAFAKVAKKFPKAKLLFVGEDSNLDGKGTYVSNCKALISKSGLDERVQWLGFRKDVPELFANLDLFVLPSYEETFGFVVIEAMGSGAPVLGTQAGGVPEILGEGEHGYLFSPKSVESLEIRLSEVLSLTSKERDLKRYNALARVREVYEKKQVYQQFINLVQSL